MLGRMKYVIAAILIAAGACLIYGGHRRSGSIAGIAERTSKDIADALTAGSATRIMSSITRAAAC